MAKAQRVKDLEAETASDEGSFPQPVKYGISPPPAVFWQRLEEYPNKDAICLYIYRLWPRIDRALTGNKHSYIDKATMLTEKELLRRWGTGKYQIRCNDTSVGKGGREVMRCVLELSDPDFPAILEYAELDLKAEVNESYVAGLRARGLLPTQKEGEMNEAKGAASSAVEVLGSLAKDAMQKKGGELSTVREVLAVVKEMNSKGGSGEGKLLELMMQQQTAILTMLLNRQGPTAAADPIEQIVRVVSLVDKLRGRGGSAASAAGSPSWVSELIGVLPAVSSSFSESLRSMATLKGTAAAPQNGVEAAGFALGHAVGAGVAEAQKTAAPSLEGAEATSDEISVARLIEVGRKALSAVERGVSGDDFAASLLTYEADGEAIFETLAAVGRDGLMQALRTLPNWAAYEAKAPAILAWFDAFLAYGDGEDGGGEPGAGEPGEGQASA